MFGFRGINQKVIEQMFANGLRQFIDRSDAKEVATKILAFLCAEEEGRVKKIEVILLPLVGVDGIKHLEEVLSKCR